MGKRRLLLRYLPLPPSLLEREREQCGYQPWYWRLGGPKPAFPTAAEAASTKTNTHTLLPRRKGVPPPTKPGRIKVSTQPQPHRYTGKKKEERGRQDFSSSRSCVVGSHQFRPSRRRRVGGGVCPEATVEEGRKEEGGGSWKYFSGEGGRDRRRSFPFLRRRSQKRTLERNSGSCMVYM